MAYNARLSVLAIIWIIGNVNAQTNKCGGQLRQPFGEHLLDGSCRADEYMKIQRRCMYSPYAPWRGRGGNIPKWYFDETECVCKSVKVRVYCDQGYDTRRECAKNCECDLPMHPGDHSGFTCKPGVRFYFNGERCYQFEYTGCGGNKNNFKTMSQCVNQCNPYDLGSSDYLQMMGLMNRMNMNRFGGRGGGGRDRGLQPPPPPYGQNYYGPTSPPWMYRRQRQRWGPPQPPYQNRWNRGRPPYRPPRNPHQARLPQGTW